MSQKTSSAPLMPGTFGAYAPAVKAGSYVFISGQLGVDPATGGLHVGEVGFGELRQLLAPQERRDEFIVGDDGEVVGRLALAV